jgi:hypothetical protein
VVVTERPLALTNHHRSVEIIESAAMSPVIPFMALPAVALLVRLVLAVAFVGAVFGCAVVLVAPFMLMAGAVLRRPHSECLNSLQVAERLDQDRRGVPP